MGTSSLAKPYRFKEVKNIEKLNMQLYVKPFLYQKVNDQFTFCKCFVLALGKNRNLTYFSKHAVDDALPSLPYIPVVAHLMYDEDNDRYYVGGHDRAIDAGRLIDVTVPYGVVMDSEFTYEDVEEPSGAVSTYLTCTVILWTGRYGELMEAKYDENVYFGQSMEIRPEKVAAYAKDDRYKDIQGFVFSCLTLLGKSDDLEYHTEPCFPSASVIPYASIDIDDMKFAEKFNELKTAVRDAGISFVASAAQTLEREDKQLQDKTKLLEQYGLTADSCEFDSEKLSYEELEAKLKESFEKDPEPQVNSEDEPDQLAGFGLNMIEKINEISSSVSEEKFTTDWGWEISRYWLVEVQDNEAIVEDATDEWNHYAIPFTMDGDYVKLDYSGKVRVKTMYEHFEGEPSNIAVPTQAFSSIVAEKVGEYVNTLKDNQTALDEFKTKYENLQTSYNEVSEKFASVTKETEEAAREAVFERFDAELSDDAEYTALKDNSELSVQDLEDKCFALVGKRKFSFVPNVKTGTAVKFGVQNFSQETNESKLYGGIREKFLNK